MNEYVIAAIVIGAVGLAIYLTVTKAKKSSDATKRAGNGDTKSRR